MTSTRKVMKDLMRCDNDEEIVHKLITTYSGDETMRLFETTRRIQTERAFDDGLCRYIIEQAKIENENRAKPKGYIKKPELSEEEKQKREQQRLKNKERAKSKKEEKKESISCVKKKEKKVKKPSSLQLVGYVAKPKEEIQETQEAQEPEHKDITIEEFVEMLIGEPIESVTNKEEKIEQKPEQEELEEGEFKFFGKVIKTHETWKENPKVLFKDGQYAAKKRGEDANIVNSAGEALWFYSAKDAKNFQKENMEIFKGFALKDLGPLVKVFNKYQCKRGQNLLKEFDQLTKDDVLIDKRITFNMQTRKKVFERDGGRCAICGKELELEHFEIDHIKPLSRGGTNEMDNLQCTCRMCNRIKDSFTEEEMRNQLLRMVTFQAKKSKKFKEKVETSVRYL